MPEVPPPSTLTADQPWPGAKPYTEADQQFFHGRRRETDELRRLLQRDVVTLLTGAARTGKTSLIRAGLLPTLNSDWLPVLVTLDWASASDQRPLSAQVLDAIRDAAKRRGLDSPQAATPAGSLWEAFHQNGARWWSSRQRIITPLIVIDQFEDAFTEGVKNATIRRHRDRFLEELSQLAANRPPLRLSGQLETGAVDPQAFDFGPAPVRLLLSMREDFAPKLITQRSIFPTISRSDLRLTDFTRDQARDALMRASAQQVLFADGVVDELLPQIERGPDADRPIPPWVLSETAHRLAGERLKRNVSQITADFFAPQSASPPPPIAPVPAPPPSTPASEVKPPPVTEAAPSRSGLIWPMAAAVLVACIGAGAWFAKQRQAETPENGETASELASATPASTPGLAAEGKEDLNGTSAAGAATAAAPVKQPRPETDSFSAQQGLAGASPRPSTPEVAPATPEAPSPTVTTPALPSPSTSVAGGANGTNGANRANGAPAARPGGPSAGPAAPPSPATPLSAPAPTPDSPPMPTPLRIPVQPTPKPAEDRDAAHFQKYMERERKRQTERRKEQQRRKESASQAEPERVRRTAPAAPVAQPPNPPPPPKRTFIPVN